VVPQATAPRVSKDAIATTPKYLIRIVNLYSGWGVNL
jgi:hypothetical protein